MKTTAAAFCLAHTALALLLACSDTSSTRKLDGAGGGPGDGPDTAGAGFSVAVCKSDTCAAEAVRCGWDSSDVRYTGCLSDCEILGTAYARCPDQVDALYACASLGAKVDCTTGKGTGCDAEEQQVASCLLTGDAGR